MPCDPVWLPIDEIIETNRSEVALTNEAHFLRDRALLEMGWMRPTNQWRYGGPDVDWASLAVALLVGIARNHPFEQGNKRTGLMSAIMFLRINGYDLEVEDSDAFAETIIDVIEHRTSEEHLIDLFRKGTVSRSLEQNPSGA